MRQDTSGWYVAFGCAVHMQLKTEGAQRTGNMERFRSMITNNVLKLMETTGLQTKVLIDKTHTTITPEGTRWFIHPTV